MKKSKPIKPIKGKEVQNPRALRKRKITDAEYFQRLETRNNYRDFYAQNDTIDDKDYPYENA